MSSDRTPTDSLTLGVASVSPADPADLRLHRHEQAEAYYILSGQGVLNIEGVEYPLAAGVTAFIPGGRLHGACATGAAPLRILYVLCADSFSQVHYDFPEETSPARGARPGG
ncbi:cupin domain-containing protein [Caulobacter sp. KR2-114]|uniref:cupin domain-containing protein n=1 Tax=Caulobacter sp. KR2-114 TaxID=3400912 RepID=UPI003BFA8295